MATKASPAARAAVSAQAAESGIPLFEQRLAAKLGGRANGMTAINWDKILQILEAIIPMMAGCFAASPQRVRQRFGNHSRLAVAIRRSTSAGWLESRELASNCFDVADESTDDEVQAFIDDCCRR